MALFYPQRRPLAIGNLYFSAKFAQTAGPTPCIFSGPPLLPPTRKSRGHRGAARPPAAGSARCARGFRLRRKGLRPAPPLLQALLYNPLCPSPFASPPLQSPHIAQTPGLLAGSLLLCGLARLRLSYFSLLMAACAAARRAIGTRKGEQET